MSNVRRGHPHGHCGPSPRPFPLSLFRSTTCRTAGFQRGSLIRQSAHRLCCRRHGVKQTHTNTPPVVVAGAPPATHKYRFEPSSIHPALSRATLFCIPLFLSSFPYFFFFGYFSVIFFVRVCKEPGLACLFYRLKFTLDVECSYISLSCLRQVRMRPRSQCHAKDVLPQPSALTLLSITPL